MWFQYWTTLAITTVVSFAMSQQLPPLNEPKIVHLLNDFEIIAERKEKPPYTVRIFKVREHGECDGSDINTCPKESVYLAISTFDEAPDENVYTLPRSYAWEFVKWKHIPEMDGKDQFIIIEIKQTQVLNKSQLLKKTVNIRFNPWSAWLIESSE